MQKLPPTTPLPTQLQPASADSSPTAAGSCPASASSLPRYANPLLEDLIVVLALHASHGQQSAVSEPHSRVGTALLHGGLGHPGAGARLKRLHCRAAGQQGWAARQWQAGRLAGRSAAGWAQAVCRCCVLHAEQPLLQPSTTICLLTTPMHAVHAVHALRAVQSCADSPSAMYSFCGLLTS